MSYKKTTGGDLAGGAISPTPSLSSLIGRVRELDKAASPAPWETHNGHDVTGYPCYFVHGFSGSQKYDFVMHENNAEFISESRTLLVQLADAAERMQAENAELKKELGNLVKGGMKTGDISGNSLSYRGRMFAAEGRVAELEGQIGEAEGMARQVMMFCDNAGCDSPRIGRNCPRCKVAADFLFPAAPSRPDTEK